MINPIRQWLLPKRRLAIAEACLIGVVSALSAVLLQHSIGWLGSWRVHTSEQYPPFLVLPAFGLVLGALSGFLVEYLAPDASGSGIPQIKAALAQYPIALDLRVAVVKLLSSIFAIAGGMTLGRQGPTVHIGAALAAQFSRWFPTSPSHRRQIIAAGSAAGLAAGFNTPIAGILFVVEELLHDFSGLTLGTAILASFIGAVISRILGGRSLDLNLELGETTTSFSAPEIPYYLLLGLLAGLLATLFNRGILFSLTLQRRFHVSLAVKMGLAGLICGCLVSLLPPAFRNNSGLRELLITGEASWQFTSLALVTYFFLAILSYGSGAPGGLFLPSLVLGSALGYLIGVAKLSFLGVGEPTTYALAGMGAFFSAVSKVPITAIVIIFEITADFNLVLPLMITCVVSYLIADQLSKGSLYQRLLEWRGYVPLTQKAAKESLTGLTAEDLMQRRVETLSVGMTLDDALKMVSRSTHQGFPVVDQGTLVGIISQSDLTQATKMQGNPPRCAFPGTTPIAEIMTSQPITVKPTASLVDVLYLLNRYHLSRLPVTEGRKLLGIITRSDIIRAELDQLDRTTTPSRSQLDPSYVVYQTRSPETGRGRLLVPIANPQTAPLLVKLAAAIARDRDYEIECLRVILVSRSTSPAETSVKTTKSRRLLRQAEKWGREWNVPVHTQIRVSQDMTQAVLETIKERHINLMLMGWKGSTSTPGRIFGNVVDEMIRQAPCDVMVVKLGEMIHPPYIAPFFQRWLIPIAGGPHSQRALEFLPALLPLSRKPPDIRLCQVFDPEDTITDTTAIEEASDFLKEKIKGRIRRIPIRASEVSEAVVYIANNQLCDVVVLGASRDGLLQVMIQENIAEAIARQVKSTVILVRRVT